jgi:hypothetical protein
VAEQNTEADADEVPAPDVMDSAEPWDNDAYEITVDPSDTEETAIPERSEQTISDIDLGDAREEPAQRPKATGLGDSPKADKEEAERQVIQVNNHFYSGVNAEGGTFGVQDGGERRDGGRRRVTGKIREADIKEVVSRYAKPACFAEAVQKLRDQRVIVIEGRPDVGRRAGAINLLREVTSKNLVVLSPALTLRDLAEREYTEGYGYLVIDRMRDRNAADLEFTWSSVSEQVRDAKAFLVITSTFVGATVSSAAVPHVTWECPPAEDVLRAQLAGQENLDAVVQELLTELPDECALARLVALARMMRDERLSPAEALKRLNENAGRDVREWFAGKPSHRAVVEVAALCFLEGTDVRTFEMLLGDLHESMARHVSGKRAKAAVSKKDADVFVEREARVDGSGLLDVRDVPSGVGTIRNVVFKDEAYRRFVLDELWRSRATLFWDAIREWLAVAVGVSGDDIAVASGLAWLACASVNEVERSFLEPWAAGLIGWPGQVTATYVLWYMCHREGLAPIALQTAVRWARDRDINRQWTAAVAFGGELGMCFPSDAINKLWQLTSQKTELWPTGCTALACLFATLSDDEYGDASTVLNLLDIKMATFGTGTGTGKKPMPAKQLLRMRSLTMSACLSVFAVNSIRNRHPAIFDYLYENPARTAMIARIWAGVIIFRPLRWEAFKALRRGLHALRDISNDPPATARAFGSALSEALPPHERLPFKNDFLRVDELLRRGHKESPAEVLLACLDAIAVKNHPGGTK